jgi:7-carboxy-7-deazaguanine synthase
MSRKIPAIQPHLNPKKRVSELPVYERFHSWQGEGVHMGKSAFFIRLHGCPVHCPWCDSAGTWHPDHKPDNVDRLSPRELAEEAFSSGCEIVIITGGEPAIHNLHDLTYELNIRNLPVHIETCGAFPIKGEMAWVTLSPKILALPLEENLRLADEFKIIVEDENSIQYWSEKLNITQYNAPTGLHPEWSQSRKHSVLSSITQWIKDKGFPYRAGFQIHKLFQADEQDERSQPIAALCTEPKK